MQNFFCSPKDGTVFIAQNPPPRGLTNIQQHSLQFVSPTDQAANKVAAEFQ